jgi:hypothetical protein
VGNIKCASADTARDFGSTIAVAGGAQRFGPGMQQRVQ